MVRVLAKVVVACAVLIIGYFILFSAVTPSIKGTVIDAETKKPVENAWVMVTVISETSTIAGSVGNTDPLTPRHLRTGKDGKFKVSSRFYIAGLPPFSFGRKVSDLKAVVRVADGRRIEMDLSKYLKKLSFSLDIPVRQEDRKPEDTNRELSNLFTYCTNGLYFPVYSYGSELCDEWELEYTIAENEKFLTELNEPRDALQRTYYAAALGGLAYLNQRKGDYEKALDYIIKARDFDKKRGVTLSQAEDERMISELKERIRTK